MCPVVDSSSSSRKITLGRKGSFLLCGTQALDDINKWMCTLQVPEGTNSVYKATDQWKDFFFVDNIPSAIEQVASPSDSKGDIYDLNGRLVRTQAEGMDGLMPGIYIKNGNKFVVK